VDKSALSQTVPDLLSRLGQNQPKVQLQAALAVKKIGPAAASTVPALKAALQQADFHTDTGLILAYLDALRAIGPAARPVADVIVGLLPEQNPIYRNRDEGSAHHLRAFMLVTLGDIGAPSSALP